MSVLATSVRVRRVGRFELLSLFSLVLLTVAGCGGGDESGGSSSESAAPKEASASEAPAAEPSTSAKESESAAATESTAETTPPAASKPAESKPAKVVDPNATGRFAGTVVLDGAAPALMPLVKAGSEGVKDAEVCAATDVPNESLVVGEGNGIANVFVYLRRAPKGFKSEPPSDPVVLDQKGCVFLPHVALIHAGQKVVVKSSDAVQHNVHTFPARNQGTNLLIKPNDQTGVELIYDRAETDPLQVKCDIHAWMSSYHLVLDHPFMAITDAEGKFSVEGLPAGDYEFRVWHERAGLLEKDYAATVTGDDEPVTLTYALDRFPAAE
ncbi:MAG: hypothetical protein RIK87_01405 [Fuerstiella sp.]